MRTFFYAKGELLYVDWTKSESQAKAIALELADRYKLHPDAVSFFRTDDDDIATK